MDNDKKLFEELLNADGINPKGPTESERAAFRMMLENEQKRMKRLSWKYVGVMWIFVLAMLGLCLSENILETLHIPFVVAALVTVAAILIIRIRYEPGYVRKMIESNRKISKLNYLVGGKHRGLILVGQKDGSRHIYWLRITIIAAGLWLIMSLGGAGIFYLLCQRWIYASSPMLYIFYCTAFSLSFVIFILYAGFKTPLDELSKVKIKSKRSKPASWHDNWRIIMISKMTKFAVATAIIIAALIGINQFRGSINMTNVAWGQVVEQLNRYERYKCRQRVVREKGPQLPTMNVYHLNLSLRRQEVEDGSIQIFDMQDKDAITIELYPDQKRAKVTKLLGFGPKKDPDIIDMVKRFDQKSAERLGTKEQNGKILYGFRHQPNKFNDFTVWVDAESKLPVEIKLIHTQGGQTIFLDEFEFDFDLDSSAFSTSIPDGYEIETIIHDYNPVEPKEITTEELRSKLNHAAYIVMKLPWMDKIITLEAIDPLGSKSKVYITGIKINDGNIIIIAQGNYYDLKRMVWLPKQQITFESPEGIKLYNHPNGSIYAEHFLKTFTEALSGFFDYKNLSEDRFTRMIVMPDETVMSLSGNKQLNEQKLQELIETLTEIRSN